MKRYVKIELPPDVVRELFKQSTGLEYLPYAHCFTIEGVFLNHEGEIQFHVYDCAERQENIRIANLD